MRRGERLRKIRVGLLVAFAGVVLLTFIMLIDERGGVFASYRTLKASFETVSGLRKGAIVFLKGVDIGEVNDIYYSGDKVMVEMEVLSKFFSRIPEDSVALIKTQGLLGDKMVEIKPGKSSKPVQEGDILHGESEGEIYENIAEAGVVVRKVSKLVSEMFQLMEHVKEGKGTLGKLIRSEGLYKELNSTFSEMKEVMSELKLAARNIKGVSRTLKAEMVDEGGLKKLNDTIAQLELLSRDLHVLILSVREGKGTAGKLLTEETFYSSLMETVELLKNLVQDIKSHPSKYIKLKIF